MTFLAAQLGGGGGLPAGGVALVDAPVIATDASLGNLFTVTLTASRTLGNPTNPVDGARYCWIIEQDGFGSHGLSLDTDFYLSMAMPPMISPSPGSRTAIYYWYDAGAGKFVPASFAQTDLA
jgi:hypothetical protein